MTYDMRNGATTQAGHHAALGASKGDDNKTSTRYIVDLFHSAGVPLRKLIVGIAFYGRSFSGVPNVNNGLLQPAGRRMRPGVQGFGRGIPPCRQFYRVLGRGRRGLVPLERQRFHQL